MTDDNSAYTEVHKLHPFPSVSMALPVDSAQQMWFHRKAQTGAFRKWICITVLLIKTLRKRTLILFDLIIIW